MKRSSISNSNALILSLREWIVTALLLVGLGTSFYFGWYWWEKFEPGVDFRVTCWAERMSDYWTYARWCRYTRTRYKVFLMGDSVIWGQEVRNDETISHYLNEHYGEETIANLGIDGLHHAGIYGLVNSWGQYLDNQNIILQFNPLWMGSASRDLRGEGDYYFHHPRLIPQLSFRIHYNRDLNTRLGYLAEHYFRLLPFVRHLMVNYYDNKSVSNWMLDNPYLNPFSAITFQSTPVMVESQGRSLDWETKKLKVSDAPYIFPEESVQWAYFVKALDILKRKDVRVYILLGPYNHYAHTPESRERMYAMISEIKKYFDDMGYPYFDTLKINLPSNTFADMCHLLKDGHIMLAEALWNDPGFQEWLAPAIE